MLVHVEIAICADLQIEASMPGEEVEHVVEKPDAGGHVVGTAAVERQPDVDPCFVRLPIHYAAPHNTSSSASIIVRVWSTTPVVIRRQPGDAGSRERSRTWTARAASPLRTRPASLPKSAR